MFAKERWDEISTLIREKGAVTTANLIDRFQVSVETIRRDLLSMEQQGLLVRVHGGAVAQKDMKPFHGLPMRNQEFGENKRALSLRAAEFLSDGDILMLDTGSTANFFAEVLKERFSRLTVITFSGGIFKSLCDHKDFSVILCGGRYMREENAFYGSLTLGMLENLHAQKAFIFPSAVSLDYGIGDYIDDLCMLQKKMIQMSDQVYILADSSKFEQKALIKVEDMRQSYRYVTDDGLPEELMALYRENELQIFTGKMNP